MKTAQSAVHQGQTGVSQLSKDEVIYANRFVEGGESLRSKIGNWTWFQLRLRKVNNLSSYQLNSNIQWFLQDPRIIVSGGALRSSLRD
jgi:hypothetical protein